MLPDGLAATNQALRERIAARLIAARGCDIGSALEVAEPVADALAYAHRKGVLHRDIKPENILFSEGHPIVADFGIAKAVSTAGGRNLTRTGVAIGTPGYMSPEQAAGFQALDERSDVYSLAVVVYEILVREIPGHWPSEEAVHAGRFIEASPLHRSRLSACGSVVEGALVRALAVRPDQRTATPLAFIDELRGVAPAAARRRYRTEEIDEIMKRAAELEATNPTASGAMTIGGVEAIAAEVGIAPSLVRSAAASLPAERTTGGGNVVPLEPPKQNAFIGGPTTILFERVIEGELPDAEFPVLVDEIRRILQNVGQVSQLGRSFSWTMRRGGGGKRDVEVAVIVRGGQTRVVVQENLGNLIAAVFAGICGGFGVGGMGPIVGILIGQLHKPPLALALAIPAWLITTYSVARTMYGYNAARREEALERLADRLALTVQELAGPPKLPAK